MITAISKIIVVSKTKRLCDLHDQYPPDWAQWKIDSAKLRDEVELTMMLLLFAVWSGSIVTACFLGDCAVLVAIAVTIEDVSLLLLLPLPALVTGFHV